MWLTWTGQNEIAGAFLLMRSGLEIQWLGHGVIHHVADSIAQDETAIAFLLIWFSDCYFFRVYGDEIG